MQLPGKWFGMKNDVKSMKLWGTFWMVVLVLLGTDKVKALALTPTATPTLTITPTPTPTVTLTPTPKGTPTWTGTPTISPTGTIFTTTFTHTMTATITKTNSPTRTMSPTATSTPGVFKFSVSPKPDASGNIKFSWGANKEAQQAFLRVRTSGYRTVKEFDFFKKEKPEYLTVGTHDLVWDGKDDEGRPMTPGTYLCFIEVVIGKKSYYSVGKIYFP